MYSPSCSGLRTFFLFLALGSVSACNAVPAVTPPMGDGATAACATDADCTDGLACNGTERCVSVSGTPTCQPSLVPLCLTGQTCDEGADRCQTDCAVARDADADGEDAEECGGTDCDDSDRRRFPGNTETCDVEDRDEDCDPTTFGVRDGDGDGEADAHCCNVDGATRHCGTDCDDASANVYPGQAETCNMRDDDCDTAVDETALLSFYPDVDHDGFGDASGVAMLACSAPAMTAPNMGDCDDMQGASNPSAPEICDGIDNNCSGTTDEGLAATLYPDVDRDGFGDSSAAGMLRCPAEGFVASATDCDDASPSARPGLAEVCDGIDNDCDGVIDQGLLATLYPDGDGDGDGDLTAASSLRCPGAGFVSIHTDCDDTSRVTYAGAPELCDTADNDCDTRIDESTVMVPWYPDVDGDGFGNPRLPSMLSCTPIAGRSQQPECDDNRADVFPGAPQLCDGVDNTCMIDAGTGHAAVLASEDADGDMHSPPAAACTGGFARDDCADTMAAVHPGAAELCDRLDYDCSSGGGVAADEDVDGDGHTAITVACTGGSLAHDDCDDARAATHPGASETCNRVDDDCSTGGGVLAAEDGDSDGYAAPGAVCTGGFPKTDCDDLRATSHPGASETCDLLDDDCDGTEDEGCPSAIVTSAGTTSLLLHAAACGPLTADTSFCPASAVLVGVDLLENGSGSDHRLDQVTSFCASLALGTSGATGAPRVYTAALGAAALASPLGTMTGTLVSLRCPAGTVATRARLGGHQLECSPLVVSGSPGAFSVTAGTPTSVVGSSAGTTIEDLDPAACGTGLVLDGFTGSYCGSVRPSVADLTAECRQLSVTLL